MNNEYGRFFLAFEAPDDEQQNQNDNTAQNQEETQDNNAVKSNTKVITATPRKLRVNFTDGIDDISDSDDSGEPNETETQDNEDNSNDSDNTNNMSDSQGNSEPDNGEEPSVEVNGHPVDTSESDPNNHPVISNGNEDSLQTSIDETNAEINANDPNLPNQDIPADTSTPDDGTQDTDTELNTDEPMLDDPNTDLSSDSDTQLDDPNQQVVTTDPNQPQQPTGAGLEYDSTRKYRLFQNYISLLNALTTYIEKIEKRVGDDRNKNYVLKIVNTKLHEIYDLCYDYVTMKFELSTYIQSLIFYQNLVIMIHAVFNTITKNIKSNKTK